MKRLLLVALMILVTLVGMLGFSRAGNAVSALQATANATNEAVGTLQATVNAGDEYSPYYDPDKGAVTELLATVNDGVQVKPKVYYLTKNSFDGGDAITACDSGFHMASISEIQDPSNLQYDTIRSTPAYDEPAYDQGFGPPSDHMGWVRTDPVLIGVPDYSDFSMSSFDQQNGTTLSLHTQVWGDSYMDPYPADTETGWHLEQIAYNRPQPVWCVEDSK